MKYSRYLEVGWHSRPNCIPTSFCLYLKKKIAMLSVSGIYENGAIRLDKRIQSRRRIKVIVTFLEESPNTKEKRLKVDDFSFSSSREKSKRFKGSISDSIIEDRREAR